MLLHRSRCRFCNKIWRKIFKKFRRKWKKIKQLRIFLSTISKWTHKSLKILSYSTKVPKKQKISQRISISNPSKANLVSFLPLLKKCLYFMINLTLSCLIFIFYDKTTSSFPIIVLPTILIKKTSLNSMINSSFDPPHNNIPEEANDWVNLNFYISLKVLLLLLRWTNLE